MSYSFEDRREMANANGDGPNTNEPQTFTAKFIEHNWCVLNADGETFAIVPHEDGYGKWAAERIANMMTGRENVCADMQLLATLMRRLARSTDGAILITSDSVTIVAEGAINSDQPHDGKKVIDAVLSAAKAWQ
jgi:hypothetical protein